MFNRKIYITLITLATLFTLFLPLIAEVIVLISDEGDKIYKFEFLSYQIEVSYKDLFFIQIIVIIVIVALTFGVQYYNIYRPFKKFNDLRYETFKHTFREPLKNLEEQISDIRLNVMKLQTVLNVFDIIYIKKTIPIFHVGFSPEHRDKYIKFWILKFFRFKYSQGICGSSIIKEEPLVGDLRIQGENNYHLSKHNLELTKDIRLVFSYPIIKWFDKKYKIVGVVNIDTHDEEFATFLLSDKGKSLLKNILRHFKYYSYFISDWM